jgi:hypothetical protein
MCRVYNLRGQLGKMKKMKNRGIEARRGRSRFMHREKGMGADNY